MEVIVFLVLVAILAAIAARFLLSVVTIRDYQRGLHYRGGKLVGLLSTGTHYAIKPMSEIQVLDVRPALLTVPGQEILTSDGVALKISLTARYVVSDPVARSRTTRAGSPRSTRRSTRACATRSRAGPRTTCLRSEARSGRRSPPRSRATSPGSGWSC
jgi:regulator of protease activity HflC (stomatin/prohibitin superfamily)